jgi:hypothetical protein
MDGMNIDTTMSEPLLKMEQDFSAEVDTKLPEMEELAMKVSNRRT